MEPVNDRRRAGGHAVSNGEDGFRESRFPGLIQVGEDGESHLQTIRSAVASAYPDHTDAFFAQGLSVKRDWNAWAVFASALGSPLVL
jgi:hypothetical protein